jgi:hypothetical protein
LVVEVVAWAWACLGVASGRASFDLAFSFVAAWVAGSSLVASGLGLAWAFVAYLASLAIIDVTGEALAVLVLCSGRVPYLA